MTTFGEADKAKGRRAWYFSAEYLMGRMVYNNLYALDLLEEMKGLLEEKGIDKATGKVLIEVSPDFYRPTDVVNLWGDPSKAKRELGWNPTRTSFEELVRIMVEHDMKKVAVERAEEHIKTNLAEYLEKGVIK